MKTASQKEHLEMFILLLITPLDINRCWFNFILILPPVLGSKALSRHNRLFFPRSMGTAYLWWQKKTKHFTKTAENHAWLPVIAKSHAFAAAVCNRCLAA